MNLKQILGLNCKHTRLSWPVAGGRHCISCGAVFDFTAYDLTDADKAQRIDHHRLQESSIKRVGHAVLTFKKRKESGK